MTNIILSTDHPLGNTVVFRVKVFFISAEILSLICKVEF